MRRAAGAPPEPPSFPAYPERVASEALREEGTQFPLPHLPLCLPGLARIYGKARGTYSQLSEDRGCGRWLEWP